MIRVPGDDDEVGEHGAVLGDDSRLGAFFNADDRGSFVNRRAHVMRSEGLADAQIQGMQVAVGHVEESTDVGVRADGLTGFIER